MTIRVYFVGAHSTGKTTLARWTARRYGIPLVSEVVRTVLAEREIPLDRLKAQVELHGEVQQEIFERQCRAEEQFDGGFVSDRAVDNLVYAADGTMIAGRLFASAAFRRYVDHVRGGIVFFCRPDRRLVADDGVRDDVSYESVLRIDGAVKTLLELLDIPYVPVTPANMQERMRLVQAVMEPTLKFVELARRVGITAPLHGPDPAAELQALVSASDTALPTASPTRATGAAAAPKNGNGGAKGNGNGNGKHGAHASDNGNGKHSAQGHGDGNGNGRSHAAPTQTTGAGAPPPAPPTPQTPSAPTAKPPVAADATASAAAEAATMADSVIYVTPVGCKATRVHRGPA